MVGKPNQKIPLQPIPAFEEPFSTVLIDCVGPLPKSKSGNEYLLHCYVYISLSPLHITQRVREPLNGSINS